MHVSELKMFTDGNVKFTLESEENVGTIVTISVPVQFLNREAEKDAKSSDC